MDLKEYVEDIYLGLNKKETRHTSNDEIFAYDLLTIKSVNNQFINKNSLDKYESLVKIADKFITKENDIIICCKPPYNVVLVTKDDENILVPSNFIILRNIKINVVYLYNYLNLLGSKMKYNNADENTNITKNDVEHIIIQMDKNKINKIADLSARINRRQKAYGKLINNDQELIKMIFIKGGVIDNE